MVSTNVECRFVKTEDGKWFFGLGDGPYGEMRWTGPFAGQDAAEEYMSNNEANPGGFSVREYDDLNRVPAQLRAQLKGASRPDNRRRWW